MDISSGMLTRLRVIRSVAVRSRIGLAVAIMIIILLRGRCGAASWTDQAIQGAATHPTDCHGSLHHWLLQTWCQSNDLPQALDSTGDMVIGSKKGMTGLCECSQVLPKLARLTL